MGWTFFKRGLKKVGHYDLLESIGRGGSGSVYKARDANTGQLVAVKLLNLETVTEAKGCKRFEQEFLAIRQLEDPHIVHGLDFGEQDGVPYLVMEFIEGESLSSLLKKRNHLSEDEAFGIVTQVAWALHRAHELGLVHRDVKPDNILLAGGVAKLTDFGLVKDLSATESLTESAASLGTPVFMAPEQFEDAKRVDCRCDIYGLAATLYKMVTGSQPFTAEGGRGSLGKKLRGELIPPRQLAPWLGVQTEWAIVRAMSVSPTMRPASCVDFIKSLTGVDICRGASVPGAAAAQQGQERRAAVRYACGREGSCRPLKGQGQTGWEAEVQDISTDGVGLLLGRRFEPGTVLLVDVPSSTEAARTLLARVVRVEAHAPQGWSVGCRLAQALKPDELKELLQQGEGVPGLGSGAAIAPR